MTTADVTPIPPPTPELDKYQALATAWHTNARLLQWLFASDFLLCETSHGGDTYWPSHRSTESLLAEYFGIDLDRLRAERAVLDLLNERAGAERQTAPSTTLTQPMEGHP